MACQKIGLVLFLFFAVIQTAASVCKISLSPDILSVNEPDGPLIFKYSYNNTASFHYPSDSNCLFPSENKQLNLACPGHDNVMQFYQKDGNEMKVVNATFNSVYLQHILTSDEYVRVVGGPSEFKLASGNYIRCLKQPLAEMHERYSGMQVNHMANDFDVLRVYSQYLIDFPSWKDQAPVTVGLINPAIQKRSVLDDNVYEKGTFYRNKTIDFSELYSKEHQRARFQGYFEDPEMTEQYFAGGNSLVVGQMLFKEDMFYPTEQMNTFYYENTVPIWKSVYEGNWRSIGNIIRKTVIGTGKVMLVYAYAWPSYQAEEMKTWTLGNTTSSPDRIPVPQMLAKAVYDSLNKERGVVFHTFNDPNLDPKVAAEKMKDYCSSTTNCNKQHPEFDDVYQGYTEKNEKQTLQEILGKITKFFCNGATYSIFSKYYKSL